jgi:hypothetical protein
MTNVQGDQAPTNTTENVEKTRELIHEDHQEKAEDPSFISRIIMADKSWIYEYSYDPQTKQQSSQWKSP